MSQFSNCYFLKLLSSSTGGISKGLISIVFCLVFFTRDVQAQLVQSNKIDAESTDLSKNFIRFFGQYIIFYLFRLLIG